MLPSRAVFIVSKNHGLSFISTADDRHASLLKPRAPRYELFSDGIIVSTVGCSRSYEYMLTERKPPQWEEEKGEVYDFI